jgi:hypothetical protein
VDPAKPIAPALFGGWRQLSATPLGAIERLSATVRSEGADESTLVRSSRTLIKPVYPRVGGLAISGTNPTLRVARYTPRPVEGGTSDVEPSATQESGRGLDDSFISPGISV